MFRKSAALLLFLLLAACGGRATPTPIAAVSLPTPVATNTALPTVTAAPTDTAPPPSVTPPPSPTPLPTAVPPTAEPTARANVDLSISAEDVTLYPAPSIYTGDFVTFQISAYVPPSLNPYEVPVQILVDGELIVDEPLGGWRNLKGDIVGLFQWVWQAGADPGSHQIEVVLDPQDILMEGDRNPDNNVAAFQVAVLEEETLPPIAQDQRWQTVETPYARIHVVTGTAAHRDQAELVALVDAAVLEAANVLGVSPVVDRKVEIFFVDRIIGQGGYAGAAMVISYLDRNYAGGGLYEVLVHESIHVLDAELEPQNRFSFLTEGLAVYGTGGHYKRENLDQRAAGLLLDTDRYIPLETLLNDFYPAQHEIGYLQAGAFMKFLADSYGQAKLLDFYRQASYKEGKSIFESLSVDAVNVYGKTLTQLETEWHGYLQSLPRSAEEALDLTLTIDYYDLMRQYQQQYDPTAYYLYAWLPSPQAMLERGLTASLTRHPQSEASIALEAMLEAADVALRSGEYTQTRALLDSVARTLSAEQFIDPLAASYLNIVQSTTALGYEPQDISLTIASPQPQANVVATDPATNQLVSLTLLLEDAEWVVTQ